jgi:hypothetical protein
MITINLITVLYLLNISWDLIELTLFWMLVQRKFYVEDGCQAREPNIPGTFQQEASQFGVRCCSLDGRSCVTHGLCPGSSTYEDAKSQCASLGRRLCTKDELLSDVCCSTGVQCDVYGVWTSYQDGIQNF